MFHINPESGVINRCNAKSASSCPYGDDEGANHFESIREGRAAYETLMSKRNFTPLSRNSKIATVTETDAKNYRKNSDSDVKVINTDSSGISVSLMGEATRTRKSERMMELALLNDENINLSLTRNPNASGESLHHVRTHSLNRETRYQAMIHANYPVENLSLDEFKRTLDVDNKEKRFMSNSIGDEHVLEILNHDLDVDVPVTSPYYNAALKMVRNGDNGVSPEIVQRVAATRAKNSYQWDHYINASGKL